MSLLVLTEAVLTAEALMADAQPRVMAADVLPALAVDIPRLAVMVEDRRTEAVAADMGGSGNTALDLFAA